MPKRLLPERSPGTRPTLAGCPRACCGTLPSPLLRRSQGCCTSRLPSNSFTSRRFSCLPRCFPHAGDRFRVYHVPLNRRERLPRLTHERRAPPRWQREDSHRRVGVPLQACAVVLRAHQFQLSRTESNQPCERSYSMLTVPRYIRGYWPEPLPPRSLHAYRVLIADHPRRKSESAQPARGTSARGIGTEHRSPHRMRATYLVSNAGAGRVKIG